jgi:proline iminopeptidase/L-proline amide hydrolase
MWGRAEFTATGTLKDYDGRTLLKRLDPNRTLFVAGEYDEAVPATVAAFAREARARFETVPGAAHTIMNDQPEAYLALLRRWLAEQDQV